VKSLTWSNVGFFLLPDPMICRTSRFCECSSPGFLETVLNWAMFLTFGTWKAKDFGHLARIFYSKMKMHVSGKSVEKMLDFEEMLQRKQLVNDYSYNGWTICVTYSNIFVIMWYIALWDISEFCWTCKSKTTNLYNLHFTFKQKRN